MWLVQSIAREDYGSRKLPGLGGRKDWMEQRDAEIEKTSPVADEWTLP